jgi:uncharacterized membrane protein YraQ (UPF0718 family)
LLLGGVFVGASSIAWAALAMEPRLDLPAIAWGLATVSGLGIGICTAASYTLLMRFVQQGRQPATDYAVFQSAQTLGEILVTTAATALAARAGYAAALSVGLAIALALAAMIFWQRGGSSQQSLNSELTE